MQGVQNDLFRFERVPFCPWDQALGQFPQYAFAFDQCDLIMPVHVIDRVCQFFKQIISGNLFSVYFNAPQVPYQILDHAEVDDDDSVYVFFREFFLIEIDQRLSAFRKVRIPVGVTESIALIPFIF